MLDIKFIRNNTELVKNAVKNKNSKVDIDHLLQVDQKRRALMTKLEEFQQQKNEVAKKISESKGDQDLIQKGKVIRSEIEGVTQEYNSIDTEYSALLLSVPNIPSDDTPIGKDDSENVVLRMVGEPRKFDFTPKAHWDLGADAGLINTEKAGEISGARFAYLMGGLVHLQFALIQFALSIVTDETILAEIIKKNNLSVSSRPFTPIIPPVMIRPEVFSRMARLEPKEERYYIPSDDMYLVGSAEHTLGPIHMDETFMKPELLPVRYIGYSTSFRREAGSYGKDTRGILRLHQFDKLELESFSMPGVSIAEQNFLVAIQEHLLQKLGLPYRAVICCTGDMGDPDARHIDLETWMPGQDTYRETHSADLMNDYQSRRLNTRVKTEQGNEFVHMNDATLVALGRVMIAIMENYQQADGSIAIPEVLKPFMPRSMSAL